MQVTLLIPELIWPEPNDDEALQDPGCPALLTLLARSRLSQRDPQSLEATLTDLFAHGEITPTPPYAALRRLGEAGSIAEAESRHWLCADPVHLRLMQERVVLADSRQFGIDLDEAQALAGALNEHLGDVCQFHVAAADRWYLQVHETTLQIALDTPPLSAATGRNIERQLPETLEARPLRKLHTEAQMLLHTHPINTAREAAGRMPINSLWFWGAGSLPARRDEEDSRFDGVWSINPLAVGLARAAGVRAHPLPIALSNLLEHAAPESEHLLVIEDLLAPVQYENGDDYRSALADLERRWFAPLRAALIGGKIEQLTIEAPTAYALLRWESRRSDQWKFWRRPQSLQALAKELASQ